MQIIGRFGKSEVPTVELKTSSQGIITVFHTFTQQARAVPHWPTTEKNESTSEVGIGSASRETLKQLDDHFRDMRTRARIYCPPTLLPLFEQHITELDATLRGAVWGHYAAVWDAKNLIDEVEKFRRRWEGYLDPPQGPPPRVQCCESDRSFWVDGKCLVTELKPKQFGILQQLANAYPNAVKWRIISDAVPGCRGGNQTRLMGDLPRNVKSILIGGPQGYALQLGPKSSTSV